jgi:transposase
MKMLKNPRMTFSQVADEVGLAVSSVIRIFDKYAGVTPISLPVCLCIDEVYAIKYRQRIFACVLVDMQTSQIYALLPTRKKADLADCFSRISPQERSKVKYICMDMYQLYKDVAEVYFPEAIICIDSFHVIKLINTAFTNIRIRVMKSFETSSEEYLLLKHFNWVLTKNSSRLDLHETVDLRRYFYAFDSHYPSIGVMIEKMSSFDFDLTAAYSMKEEYAYINSTSTPENAEQRIDNFIGELLLYDVRELRGVASTLRHWKKEIVNSFNRVDGQRISNGPIESVNSRIKKIKQNGNGYRIFERFKLRALYSLNGSSSIKN